MAEQNFFDTKTIIIAVLGIAIAGLLYFNYGTDSTSLTGQKAAEAALSYINTKMLQGQATAEISGEIQKVSGVYMFNVSLNGESFPSYVSKDGKLLFPQGIEMVISTTSEEQTGNPNVETEKSEVPSVKLFVMSYCPYGLQAEKGFLPVYELLKGKADMGIYFVDYAMHEKQEIDENLRQYCIEKEQTDKFATYLSCFISQGKADTCLTTAQIDATKLNICEKQADQDFQIEKNYADKATWSNGQFPQFNVHKDLNDKYGVQGSPTLVINGKVVSVNRDPETIKQAVCNSFITPPEECAQTLSSDAPVAGFGDGVSAEGSAAECEQ